MSSDRGYPELLGSARLPSCACVSFVCGRMEMLLNDKCRDPILVEIFRRIDPYSKIRLSRVTKDLRRVYNQYFSYEADFLGALPSSARLLLWQPVRILRVSRPKRREDASLPRPSFGVGNSFTPEVLRTHYLPPALRKKLPSLPETTPHRVSTRTVSDRRKGVKR